MYSKKLRISFKGHSLYVWPFLLHTTAGQSILIGQGFVTQPGAVFTAEIKPNGDCQTPGVQTFSRKPPNMNVSGNDTIVNAPIVTGMNTFAYPNPATDMVTIGATNNNYKNILFVITDLSGRFISQYDNPAISVSDVKQTIDISSFAEGMYLVTMIADEQKYSFKIAKE